MKTAKLFGVRFVTEPGWKDNLLQHHIATKTKKENAEFQKELTRLKMMEERFGLPTAEIKEELEKNRGPFNFTEVTHFTKEEARCQHYYITAPVLEMCQRIRVKEPYDVDWLSPVADGKRQLNFGNQLIRYEKTGSRIVALSAQCTTNIQEKEYLNYSFFNMDLQTKHISASQIPDDYDPSNAAGIPFQDFEQQSRKLFFQLITFMELSKIQEILLPPGRKNGVKKSPDHLLNDSSFPITIVNTNWNKIIRREGFDVEGHLRKQAFGPCNSKRKLIWVDDYHKSGYNLGAAKVREQKRRGQGL